MSLKQKKNFENKYSWNSKCVNLVLLISWKWFHCLLISLIYRGGLALVSFYSSVQINKMNSVLFNTIYGEARGEAERINFKVNQILPHSLSSFLTFLIEMQRIKMPWGHLVWNLFLVAAVKEFLPLQKTPFLRQVILFFKHFNFLLFYILKLEKIEGIFINHKYSFYFKSSAFPDYSF